MEITNEFEFAIDCAVCGQSLDVESESLEKRQTLVVLSVKPCQRCLNNAEDKGYVSGENSVSK